MKIAINGLGRIGKNFLRAIVSDATTPLDIVAINIGPADPEHVAYTLRYDTLMGTYTGAIEQKGDYISIGNEGKKHTIKIVHEADPRACPWRELGVDWVVDCSGRFTDAQKAQAHIQAGARKVLISAPAKNEDVTIIPGVNDDEYHTSEHTIVSLGSCTTNAFLPLLKVLDRTCGIVSGLMTTVHAYTNSQVLLDGDHKDLRRSRAAAINIIPTTTGASKVVGKVMAHLEGKMYAKALRVPVAKGSFIEVIITPQKAYSAEQINQAFGKAAQTDLKGILAINSDPIVSSDCTNTPWSVIVDGLLTSVNNNTMSVCGWYDNEWAYSLRMKEFLSQPRI